MTVRLDDDQVRSCTDVDLLWEEFLSARQVADDARAEIIQARMAQLQQQQSAAALEDDQLLAQITGLEQQRAAALEDPSVADIDEVRLASLLEEANRRQM